MTKDEEGLVTISLPKEEMKEETAQEEIPTPTEQADLVASTPSTEVEEGAVSSKSQPQQQEASPAAKVESKPKKTSRKTKATSK